MSDLPVRTFEYSADPGSQNASDARIEAAWRKFWGDAPEEPKAPCPT